MNGLSLSSLMTVRLALVLSLSVTAYSFSPKLKFSFPLSLSSSSSSSATVATAGDILSLLGPRDQASNVDPHVAQELWSCFKFLVPFEPMADGKLRSMASYGSSSRREKENKLIWWPPGPVMELARLAFDSGGDADSVHRALDPSIIPVPDVEGSKENKCELTRTPYGRQFINEELNSYLKFLFEMIVSRGPSVGLNVSLSRYDLFHGHLFLTKDTGRLGIL